jgi:hypothetical protein
MMVPAFGPAIPIIPRRDFDKGFTLDQLQELWRIVGPSVMLNMGDGLPMWQVITAAYGEGLMHGYGIRDKQVNSEPDPTTAYREVLIKRGKRRNGNDKR